MALDTADANRWYFALTGISTEVDSYEFFPGAELRRVVPGTRIDLNGEDAGKIIQAGRLLEWLQTVSHELVVDRAEDINFVDAIMFARFFTTAVRICTLAYPLILFAAPYSWADTERSLDEDFIIQMLEYIPFENVKDLAIVFPVSSDHLDWVKRHIPAIAALNDSKDPVVQHTFQLAYRCMNEYLYEKSLEMRVLKIYTGLEALFGFVQGSRQLAWWISKYLTRTDGNRVFEPRDLEGYLEIRTDIVHARRQRLGKPEWDDDNLMGCLFQLRKALSVSLMRAVTEQKLPSKRMARRAWTIG